MSCERAVFYRAINGYWYFWLGVRGDTYSDQTICMQFHGFTLGDCLRRAHIVSEKEGRPRDYLV